jgi:hypothetical protein
MLVSLTSTPVYSSTNHGIPDITWRWLVSSNLVQNGNNPEFCALGALLGNRPGYRTYWTFSRFSSVPLNKCRDSNFNSVTPVSLNVIFTLYFSSKGHLTLNWLYHSVLKCVSKQINYLINNC